MSISVGGQAIPSPTLIAKPGSPSNAAQYPLLCDLQYMEPYATQGLNRKMRNIVLPGIYNGFKVSPGTGLTVNVSSTGESGGGASINIGTHWQVSINQLFDVSVPVKQGQWIVALKATYDPLNGVMTRQVNLNSTIEAAEFVVISVASGLQANMIEICRVNIPQVTQITDPMIDRTHRVERRIGLQLTDNTDQSDTDIAASALAVKKTWDEAQAIKAAALMRGEGAIGANAVHQLDMEFDWQNHRFVGGEYDLIDWDTAKTTTKGAIPDIDYPSGRYQVHVIGLSDTDNQTLLIRPFEYSKPLAPFMISWTGAAGSRVFKTRALITNFDNLSSLGAGPNDLTLRCHVGIFGQPANANALAIQGYPIPEAGTLTVTTSAYGRPQQEYVAFMSGSRFTRAMTPKSDGTGYEFMAWIETPTLQKDGFWKFGTVLGLNPGERNRVYLDNRTYGINKIASGIRTEWYDNYCYAGLRRGGTTDILGYSIELNDVERLRVKDIALEVYSNRVAVFDDAPAYCFYNKSGQQVANFQYTVSTGALTLWHNDGTSLSFQGGMIHNNSLITGSDKALLRGASEGGSWDKWRDYSSGLQLDMPTNDAAYNVWKATQWGTEHVAAMSVLRSSANNGDFEARLHVGGVDYIFNSHGDFSVPHQFNVETVAARGEVNACNAQTRLMQNAIIIQGTGNKHLWFYSPGGAEVGLVYASDDNVLHLRAAQGPSVDVDAAGNLLLNSSSVVSSPGGFNIPGVSGNGAPASTVILRNWGMPTGDRKTVFEVSDATSWLYYAQRTADNTVTLAINGNLQAGTVGCLAVLATNNINAHNFYTEGNNGAGGFAGQMDSGAPFFQYCGQRPAADNTYFPLVKGRVQLDTGYPTAVSFGLVTGGGVWAGGVIQVKGDNQEALFSFTTAGNFSATSISVQNAITTTSLSASSAINCGDSDSGLYANGDGNVAFRANGVHVAMMNQSEFRTSAQIVATTDMYCGGGTSRWTTNGDINGTVWGGWLSTVLAGKGDATSGWVNTRISDVQTWAAGTFVQDIALGGQWETGYLGGGLANGGGPNVLVGLQESKGDNEIHVYQWRPIQKRTNAGWVNVGNTA